VGRHRRLKQPRAERALEAGEAAALRSALQQGLDVLEAGVAPLLDAPMATSLGSAAIARLWAAALDAVASTQMLTMTTLAQKLVDNCAAMSGAQLAAAMGL